jgi:hypothetical protein
LRNPRKVTGCQLATTVPIFLALELVMYYRIVTDKKTGLGPLSGTADFAGAQSGLLEGLLMRIAL